MSEAERPRMAETMEQRLAERIRQLRELASEGKAFIRTHEDEVCDGVRISPYPDLAEICDECLRLMALNEWVKVGERLPEVVHEWKDYGYTFCESRKIEFISDGEPYTGWYSGEKGKELNFVQLSGERVGKVTHWREITLPEGEKK